MIRNLIRYLILTIIIIGIVVLLSNLFTKGNSNFNSNNKLNNNKYYTASIRILDKESKKFINGGEFILKTKDGKIIEEWEGNENIHRVSRLKNGTYILEQKSAADGYEKAKNQSFKIDNSDKDVIMFNSVIVEEEVIISNEVTVDNTLSIKSCLSYIVSISIIISGFGLIFLQKRCYNK